jgi:hypothetical protein
MHVPGAVMRLLAPDVMLVFGQIRQVTEIGERADHTHRLLAAERGQTFFESSFCLRIRIPAKRHRQPADLLNQRECLFAFLFANDIAQQAAEPTDIVYQGLSWLDKRVGLRAAAGLRCLEIVMYETCDTEGKPRRMSMLASTRPFD